MSDYEGAAHPSGAWLPSRSEAPTPPMHPTHNPLLIALSVLIAILASYAALDLAGRISASTGRSRSTWLVGGSLAMGTGIWSMHFVGMLALSAPFVIGYQVTQVVLSAVVAIGASLFALFIAARRDLSLPALLASAACMGLAIAGMHYIGMDALQTTAHVRYDSTRVAVSVAIAIVASGVALRLAHVLQTDQESGREIAKTGSALVMGFAIAGMHYTGMSAVTFTPDPLATFSTHHVLLNGPELIAPVILSSLAVLGAAVFATTMHRRIARRILETTQVGKASLREQQEFLRKVIDANPNLIFVKNWDGEFVLANTAVAEIYGTTPAELTGKTDADFNPNREEVKRFIEHDREVMANGHEKLIKEEAVTNPVTGKMRWFQTVKVPLIGSDGNTRQVLGVSMEITERRILEERLREAQKMDAIGQLTGGIAHDLNNILTAIMVNAELVTEGLPADQPSLRADMDELQSAAARGADMVRKLLAFSRREKLELKTIGAERLVVDISRTVQRLLPPSIELEIRLEPDLPAIRADAGAVERTVMNLCTNARDAMPQGGKLLLDVRKTWMDEEACTAQGWGRAGKYVSVSVSDTGVGISAEIEARLFEPFFTTKGAGAGTGLGLAIVYGLMRQQDGNVQLRSTPGKGTTFELRFPASDAPETASAEAMPAPRPTGGDEKILLVDDEASIRRAGARGLTGSGYLVLTAADGEEALGMLHNDPDIVLVVSDMVMPKLGGCGLLEEARNAGHRARFLLSSGYSADALRANAGLDRSVPFLHKPWTVSDLLNKVRQVLDAAPNGNARVA